LSQKIWDDRKKKKEIGITFEELVVVVFRLELSLKKRSEELVLDNDDEFRVVFWLELNLGEFTFEFEFEFEFERCDWILGFCFTFVEVVDWELVGLKL